MIWCSCTCSRPVENNQLCGVCHKPLKSLASNHELLLAENFDKDAKISELRELVRVKDLALVEINLHSVEKLEPLGLTHLFFNITIKALSCQEKDSI